MAHGTNPIFFTTTIPQQRRCSKPVLVSLTLSSSRGRHSSPSSEFWPNQGPEKQNWQGSISLTNSQLRPTHKIFLAQYTACCVKRKRQLLAQAEPIETRREAPERSKRSLRPNDARQRSSASCAAEFSLRLRSGAVPPRHSVATRLEASPTATKTERRRHHRHIAHHP